MRLKFLALALLLSASSFAQSEGRGFKRLEGQTTGSENIFIGSNNLISVGSVTCDTTLVRDTIKVDWLVSADPATGAVFKTYPKEIYHKYNTVNCGGQYLISRWASQAINNEYSLKTGRLDVICYKAAGGPVTFPYPL